MVTALPDLPITDAERVCELLRRAKLSQSDVAGILEIHVSAMHSYCVGGKHIPGCVILALERPAYLRIPS